MTSDSGEKERLRTLLGELESDRAQLAWQAFLEAYAETIFHSISLLERDPDNRGDSFLYVCQQLNKNRFRRLRKFKIDGPARFTTWLRAVVRNLYLDWRRQRFGRNRGFKALRDLTQIERKVYECVFEKELEISAAHQALRSSFPSLTEAKVAEAVEKIRVLLPRDYLESRRLRNLVPLSLDHSPAGSMQPLGERLSDENPGPETAVLAQEQTAQLGKALSELTKSESHIIRLRFAEELTLEQIGRVIGLTSPQSVRYRLQKTLDKLKLLLE